MSADHPGIFPDDDAMALDLFALLCGVVVTLGGVAAVFNAIVLTTLLTVIQAIIHVFATIALWVAFWLLYTMEPVHQHT